MAGQGATANFDVTNLVINEPATAPAPSIIIPLGGEFSLTATFTGSGPAWNGFKALGAAYSVSYYVEGLGANASEKDLGAVAGVLVPAKDTYGDPETTLNVAAAANDLKEGVYRVACLVTFPAVPGMTGFFENLIVEVHPI
jgi:hypothetical protein